MGAIAVVVAATAATMMGFAGPAASAPQVGNECHGAFRGDAPGSLELEITDTSGTSVTFLASWDTDDWAVAENTGELDKILLCFEVDGQIVDTLTKQEKPTLNDGEYEVTVDFASIDDEEICAAARLSGQPAAQNPSTTKSEILCFDRGEPGEETTTSLRVTKSVVGDPGGDTFAFSVDCAPVSLTAENTDGSGVTITDGVATFTLANGQSETFTGLPEKTSCDVTETINGTHSWTTTINGTASSTRVADDIAATEGVTTVAFQNSRVYSYACAAATDVTPTEAAMNGSTDDPSVTAADFALSGRDPVAGTAGSGGKYSAKATGLAAGTNYTYTVVFKNGSNVVGTSATCSFTTGQTAVVAGVVLTNPAPAAPAAAAPAVAGATLAATGSSSRTIDVVTIGLALTLLGLVLVAGSRTLRPVGQHSSRG